MDEGPKIRFALARPVLAFCVMACGLCSAQQPRDPVLENWDRQFALASSRAQTAAARDRVTGEINAYLEAHAADPSTYRTIVLGYNHLTENDRVVIVLRAFFSRFPSDTSLDALALLLFSNYGTVHDILTVPDHAKNQPKYWYFTFGPLQREHAAPEPLHRAGVEDLRRTPSDQDNGGEERILVAEMWLSNGVDPHAAEQVAREALKVAEIGPSNVIPASGETRKILDRETVRSINRSTLGWALFKEGRYVEARTELERASKLAQNSSFSTMDIYYRLGRTLEKLGNAKAALLAYDEEIAWGSPNHSDVKKRQAGVYQKVHGSLQGLDSDEFNRVNTLAMQRSEGDSALVRDLDQDLGYFALPDEHGHALDLKQYRGKLVVLDFWATWCSPCLIGMKELDGLQKQYPGQLVVVAADEDPELTQSQARRYLNKMGYSFMLVYDDDTKRAIHVPYVPARILMDQNGRLRFIEFGIPSSGKLAMQNKIAQLLQP